MQLDELERDLAEIDADLSRADAHAKGIAKATGGGNADKISAKEVTRSDGARAGGAADNGRAHAIAILRKTRSDALVPATVFLHERNIFRCIDGDGTDRGTFKYADLSKIVIRCRPFHVDLKVNK